MRALVVVDLIGRLPFFSSVERACQALLEASKPPEQRAIAKLTDPELELARKDAVMDATESRSEILRMAAHVRLGEIVREQQQRRVP